MEVIRFTLLTDGSSDKVLLNIIKWLLNDLYPQIPNQGSYADFRNIKNPPKSNEIEKRIALAEKMYPFEILFYHRDAENNKKTLLIPEKLKLVRLWICIILKKLFL